MDGVPFKTIKAAVQLGRVLCSGFGFQEENQTSVSLKRWGVVVLLVLATLCSCAFRDQPVVLKSGEIPFDGNICRIAVVPFSNETDYKMAETIFGRVLASDLIEQGNYLISHEGDVRRILTQMRMLPGQELSSEQIRGLADRLGVQIVISGTVLETRGKPIRSKRSSPSLAVVLRIMEASSGRTIWTTYNRAEGSDYRIVLHFGVVNTVSSLAKKVSTEIINVWIKEGLNKCTE